MPKPTYDKETRVWSGRKVLPIYNPDQNLGQLILSVLQFSPDIVSQVSADTGVSVTCREMRERILKIAVHLSELELKQGDVVGVVAGNTENLAPAVFACFLLGLPVNPLAPVMVERDIFQTFGKTKPKLIICDGSNLKTVQAAVNSLQSEAKIYTVMEDIEGFNSITKVLNSSSANDMHSYPDVDSNAIAAIIMSSGSISTPKGICKTHRELICCIKPIYDWNPNETPVMFQSSSIFWFSGFFFLLFSTLFRYVRVITARPYHPKHFAEILTDHKVSLVITPPFMLTNLMESGFLEPLEHMRCWMLGGAAVSKKLIDSLRPLVPNAIIANIYASTEANAIAINTRGIKVESCGQPDPNLEIKIVDDDGKALENFQQGEIYTKRAAQFSCYFQEPKLTQDAFDNGWFKTGDLGYFDDEGFLYFVERKKEMIRCKGYTVIPTELETIISEIEGVVSSCVVGIFDEVKSCDTVHAFVIASGSSGLTEEVIREYAGKRVHDGKKLRGRVHFADSFPLGLSGKVDKKIMRARAEEIMRTESIECDGGR